MNDRQKAMMLNIAFAAFESVRADEVPKTARHQRLSKGIDRLLELTEIYCPEAWPNEIFAKLVTW
jgi:hypothetical protein